MRQTPDTDSLWRRSMEAISEARDLIEAHRRHLEETAELAYQRLLSANASRAFARRATNVAHHASLVSPAEDADEQPAWRWPSR